MGTTSPWTAGFVVLALFCLWQGFLLPARRHRHGDADHVIAVRP